MDIDKRARDLGERFFSISNAKGCVKETKIKCLCSDIKQALQAVRDETIEECAELIEGGTPTISNEWFGYKMFRNAQYIPSESQLCYAEAIRALKERKEP